MSPAISSGLKQALVSTCVSVNSLESRLIKLMMADVVPSFLFAVHFFRQRWSPCQSIGSPRQWRSMMRRRIWKFSTCSILPLDRKRCLSCFLQEDNLHSKSMVLSGLQRVKSNVRFCDSYRWRLWRNCIGGMQERSSFSQLKIWSWTPSSWEAEDSVQFKGMIPCAL